MHRTRTIAAGLALVLALALPASALAADVSETLAVNGTITVTGLPASINYGALDAGTRSPDQVLNYHVTANGDFVTAITGTDFARNGGGASIAKGAREGWMTTPSSGANCTPPELWTAFSSPLSCTGTMGATKDYTLKLRVNVPGGQMAGNYTGTVSVVVSVP